MSIKVTIKSADNEDRTLNVQIKGEEYVDYMFELQIREAINGDFLIFDHSDIDIVILKQQSKIVAFAKDLMTESVYGAEARLFDYLRKKGVVMYDSIQGGNVYGSLEGKIIQSKEQDVYEISIMNIAEWIKTEKPIIDGQREYEDSLNDMFVNPSDAETTELGEVPHEEEKGSMAQRGMFAPYIYGRYSY